MIQLTSFCTWCVIPPRESITAIWCVAAFRFILRIPSIWKRKFLSYYNTRKESERGHTWNFWIAQSSFEVQFARSPATWSWFKNAWRRVPILSEELWGETRCFLRSAWIACRSLSEKAGEMSSANGWRRCDLLCKSLKGYYHLSRNIFMCFSFQRSGNLLHDRTYATYQIIAKFPIACHSLIA